MLQNHKATRQRSIHVRTYKVVPLTANAGIIEFVPNSLPLGEFLNPAHPRYHPSDMKMDQVRNKIGEAARMTKEVRHKVFKEATAQYQPVLRHFFFERFNDPDEWFERRLAYTRSTAAISIISPFTTTTIFTTTTPWSAWHPDHLSHSLPAIVANRPSQ